MSANTISPFRLTAEDMPDLDKKTANGIAPMLDALNITLQQVVNGFSRLPAEQYVPVTLVTGATVADSFPITFKHNITKPQCVLLANIVPKDPDHIKTDPFVLQGWSLTDANLVSVPWITNLLASNSYQLTFYVR